MPARICCHPGCSRTCEGRCCDRHKGSEPKPKPRANDPRQKALNSKVWRKLRLELLREWVQKHGPYCALCGGPLDFGKRTHGDHIERHTGAGDPRFTDSENVQFICNVCHGVKTRSEEQ